MQSSIFIYLLTYGSAGSPLLCARLSVAAVSWGHSLVAVHRLLIAVASLAVEHRPWGAQALGSTGFSLQWLPLSWSTGPREHRPWGAQALGSTDSREHRL